MNIADRRGGVANDLAGIIDTVGFTVIICRPCKTAKIDVVGAGAAKKRRVKAGVVAGKGVTDDLAGTVDRIG